MKERLIALVYALFVLGITLECCEARSASAQARTERRQRPCDTRCHTDSGGHLICKTTCR